MPELRYMLDTNIVSELVRRPAGDVAQRAGTLEPGSMAISIIVASELRYGAERLGSVRLARQLDAVMSVIETLPLSEPADRHYGLIRSALERIGRPIGHNDLLIAAHARALGATLVTKNVGNEERWRIQSRPRSDDRGLAIKGRTAGRRMSRSKHNQGRPASS